MKSILAVFIGGGLGSISRFALSKWLNPVSPKFFLGTLSSNVLACVILGFMTHWVLKQPLNEFLKIMIMVGFCGGFSTFSTFSKETYELIQKGDYTWSVAYVLLSLVTCTMAIVGGMMISKVVLK